MKDLVKYYKYADFKLINLLESMTDEEFSKTAEFSSKSVRDIAEHIMIYYTIITEPDKKFKEMKQSYSLMAKSELLQYWKNIVEKFVEAVNGMDINKKYTVKVSKEKLIDVTFEEYIFSYSDHSTYHRGQIIDHYKFVTGNQNAVATDYFGFLVKKYSTE